MVKQPALCHPGGRGHPLHCDCQRPILDRDPAGAIEQRTADLFGLFGAVQPTDRGRRIAAQWPGAFDNRFITNTPAMIRPMPIIVARSSFCPKTHSPIPAVSTMPSPDHIA